MICFLKLLATLCVVALSGQVVNTTNKYCVGNIPDLNKVKAYFGLSTTDDWLSSVTYAISPSSELMVFGLGEKLAFLSSFWDNKLQITTYILSWSGEINDTHQIITALTCLPIYGETVTTGPEWTCIAVGLSSGFVIYYTDAGVPIFSQSYHDDCSVFSIQAYTPPPHSDADSLIFIVYEQCICTIKSSDLLTTLNLMRESKNKNATESTISGLPAYQKLFFTNTQRPSVINDAVIANSATRMHTYDHVVEQTLNCGYYARVSQTLLQSTPVLTIGVEPFLGFFQADEGYKTASFGEAAKDLIGIAYASIFGGIADNEIPARKRELVMRTRFGFYDGKRDGIRISLTAEGNLAIVSDNLDRVMLVDIRRSIILRVWKGYRDAQCAFVSIEDRALKHSKHRQLRKALFLIIYTPGLGCIEIFSIQNGSRIAAFTVGKHGQLSCNIHGILGKAAEPKNKVKPLINACLFLDPIDSCLKEFIIPFHYALSETNSTTSRDIHLLRRLRNVVREITTPNEESLSLVSSIAADFKTVEVRQQCLQMLIKNKQLKPEVFKAIIYGFEQTIDENLKESESLSIKLQNYIRLTEFYITMRNTVSKVSYKPLKVCEADLVIINKILMLFNEHGEDCVKGITFQEHCKSDGDFVEYLNIFDIDNINNIKIMQTKSETFGYVGSKIFEAVFEKGVDVTQFTKIAKISTIEAEDLLTLLVNYWIRRPFSYKYCDDVLVDMSRLAAAIRAICQLSLDKVNKYAYNEISPWWQKIREILLESQKCLGLLVAITCKIVAFNLRFRAHKSYCDRDNENENDVECWEQISHDEAQWSLFIGKLEDVAVLAAVLEQPVLNSATEMPELPYEKPDCSLKAILAGGKGIISQLTAQWVMHTRMQPCFIIEANNLSDHDSNITEKQDTVLRKLQLLREHFPFSLEPGVLLCIMSWEYTKHWSKNLTQLENLRAALTCLESFTEPDLALKHGICCLIWNATLKFPLQALAKLIQKVGRLPKEKMCKQDIEMSAALVPEFLDVCLQFMKHFTSSLEHDKRELKFEETLAEGPLPLAFISLQQHHAIKELLILHYELLTVLYFITFFQLKWTKPVTTLFDAMTNKAFFVDINNELNFILPDPDKVLQQKRELFLCNVITASMDLIRQDLQQLYVEEYHGFINRIYELADSWKLEKDQIKRKQVIELYNQGYDNEGEELFQIINKDEDVGRALLEIAGRRLCLYMKSSQSVYLNVASVGPQLLQFLDKLEPIATDAIDVNLEALAKLTSLSFECLSQRESKFLHIAAQMYDACSVLLK